MATQPAYSTIGVKVYRGNGATPEVFTEVPKCIAPPPIGETRQEIDVTPSSASARERIAGRKDGDSLEFRFNYIKGNTVQQALIQDYRDSRQVNMRVTAENDTQQVWGFATALLYCGVQLDLDGHQILIVRARISGDVDWNASL